MSDERAGDDVISRLSRKDRWTLIWGAVKDWWRGRHEPVRSAPTLAAPCRCTINDDVCPFRGPTGKPQCEDFG